MGNPLIEQLERQLAAEKVVGDLMPAYDDALEAYRADPADEGLKDAYRQAAQALDEARTEAGKMREAAVAVTPATAEVAAEAHEPGTGV